MTRTVTIATMKNRLSEYVSLASAGNTRILITRRKRPLAALVPLDDLKRLGQQRQHISFHCGNGNGARMCARQRQ